MVDKGSGEERDSNIRNLKKENSFFDEIIKKNFLRTFC